MARRDNTDPDDAGFYSKWAFSWPANRRILYNRASADINGKPWDPSAQDHRVGRHEMVGLRRSGHRADGEAGRGRTFHHESRKGQRGCSPAP